MDARVLTVCGGRGGGQECTMKQLFMCAIYRLGGWLAGHGRLQEGDKGLAFTTSALSKHIQICMFLTRCYRNGAASPAVSHILLSLSPAVKQPVVYHEL